MAILFGGMPHAPFSDTPISYFCWLNPVCLRVTHHFHGKIIVFRRQHLQLFPHQPWFSPCQQREAAASERRRESNMVLVWPNRKCDLNPKIWGFQDWEEQSNLVCEEPVKLGRSSIGGPYIPLISFPLMAPSAGPSLQHTENAASLRPHIQIPHVNMVIGFCHLKRDPQNCITLRQKKWWTIHTYMALFVGKTAVLRYSISFRSPKFWHNRNLTHPSSTFLAKARETMPRMPPKFPLV